MAKDAVKRLACRTFSTLAGTASPFWRLMLAALLFGAASCNDVTGARSLNVAISVTNVSTPAILTTPDSVPQITCVVDLSATASGTGSATWFEGKIIWYVGADRSVPVDSQPLSLTEMQSSWGAGAIAAGQTQTSRWTVWAGAPFHAVMEYNYEPANSGMKTAKAEFDCGPKVSANTPPPTIDTITVEQAAGAFEPGDTLTVDYTVSSSVGIWQTAVDLSGPCSVQRVITAKLQTKLSGAIGIPIPAACQLYVPITVTVFARDAALQTGSKSLATPDSLVDHTPPYLLAQFFPPHNSGILSVVPSGFAFGGDALETVIDASDNHELHVVEWQVLPSGAGVDDSLVVNGQGTDSFVSIYLRPSASGPVQFRLFARDAVGNVSDTITTPAGSFYVYPSAVVPAASATIDAEVTTAIPDPRRQLAYLLAPNDKSIQVLSLSTMAVTQKITLPVVPADFDITAGGDSLIVSLPYAEALGIIDLRQSPLAVSLLPLDSIDTTGAPHPGAVRTLSNGKVFVTLQQMLDEVDLATGVQRVRHDAGAGGFVGPAALGRSLDHAVLVVNGGPTYFQRYDVLTDRFGPRLSPNGDGASLDSTGQHVSTGRTVYDDSLRVLTTAASGWPMPVSVPTILSPDGTTLYQIIPDGSVVRNRVTDGAVVDRIINPIDGGGGMPRISDDGTLLVTMEGDPTVPNKVSVIHLH